MLAVEQLTEPVYIPNTNVDGLSHIEDSEDGRHTLVIYSKRESLHGGHEYIVEARLVATYPVLLAGVVTVLLHMGAQFRASVLKAVYGGRTVH